MPNTTTNTTPVMNKPVNTIDLGSKPTTTDLFALIPEGSYKATIKAMRLAENNTRMFLTLELEDGTETMLSLTDDDYSGKDQNGVSYTIDSALKQFFGGLNAQYKTEDSILDLITKAKAEPFEIYNKHYTSQAGNISNQFTTQPRRIAKLTREASAESELA